MELLVFLWLDFEVAICAMLVAEICLVFLVYEFHGDSKKASPGMMKW